MEIGNVSWKKTSTPVAPRRKFFQLFVRKAYNTKTKTDTEVSARDSVYFSFLYCGVKKFDKINIVDKNKTD